MVITRNLSSELAQTFYITLGHQCVSENVIKILGDFGAIFWKKVWAIVQGNFQKWADFKSGHNSKPFSRNQLNDLCSLN